MGKRIGICGIYRGHQFGGGAYSYLENLMRGIADVRRSACDDRRFDVVVFRGSQNIRWTDEQFTYRQIPDRFGRMLAETRVGLCDSAHLDAVLFPNFFTPPVVRSRRVVTVIHDLQYLHLPEYWPLAKRVMMRAIHEVTLRRCDSVVVISQTVKDDLLKKYGERWEPRIKPIWNPVSLDRFRESPTLDVTNGRPYILSIGVDRPTKNLARLIRAFVLLQEKYPEYCLVLAGQLRAAENTWTRKSQQIDENTPSATDLVKRLGLGNDVVVTGFVSDEQLGALYRGASLFVLPSLFEGFGMPAVEALALGAPSLVTDLPALREVTLNRAQYISDPHNEHEIADRMGDILRLGDAGRPSMDLRREVEERFSPITIARQYLSVLVGNEL
jgi:glycosyltransferase involved in cell wall biosynthesis